MGPWGEVPLVLISIIIINSSNNLDVGLLSHKHYAVTSMGPWALHHGPSAFKEASVNLN